MSLARVASACVVQDIDVLMDVPYEGLRDVRETPEDWAVLAGIENARNLVITALFWRYMKENAERRGEFFELPQVVRDNLNWKPEIGSTSDNYCAD